MRHRYTPNVVKTSEYRRLYAQALERLRKAQTYKTEVDIERGEFTKKPVVQRYIAAESRATEAAKGVERAALVVAQYALKLDERRAEKALAKEHSKANADVRVMPGKRRR